jgi:hypothetical protein
MGNDRWPSNVKYSITDRIHQLVTPSRRPTMTHSLTNNLAVKSKRWHFSPHSTMITNVVHFEVRSWDHFERRLLSVSNWFLVITSPPSGWIRNEHWCQLTQGWIMGDYSLLLNLESIFGHSGNKLAFPWNQLIWMSFLMLSMWHYFSVDLRHSVAWLSFHSSFLRSSGKYHWCRLVLNPFVWVMRKSSGDFNPFGLSWRSIGLSQSELDITVSHD